MTEEFPTQLATRLSRAANLVWLTPLQPRIALLPLKQQPCSTKTDERLAVNDLACFGERESKKNNTEIKTNKTYIKVRAFSPHAEPSKSQGQQKFRLKKSSLQTRPGRGIARERREGWKSHRLRNAYKAISEERRLTK